MFVPQTVSRNWPEELRGNNILLRKYALEKYITKCKTPIIFHTLLVIM